MDEVQESAGRFLQLFVSGAETPCDFITDIHLVVKNLSLGVSTQDHLRKQAEGHYPHPPEPTLQQPEQ